MSGQFTKLSTIALIALYLAGLAGCAEPAETLLTQTPVFLVVTSETPQTGAAEESGTPSPAGFPTPFTCSAEVVEQSFERGRMFWVGSSLDERCRETHDFVPGSGEIWVLFFGEDSQGGEWFAFVDEWNADSEIPFDITMTEPAGVTQPVRGFGKVWRERLTQEQRDALGWATGPEIKFVTTYRYDAGGFVDEQGTYIPRPGQHTLVSFGGERFFLDEQTRRFQYIPAD